jgi:uncharacterized membrane protein
MAEWLKRKGEYMKTSTIVTVVFLFLVSIAHLLRLILQVKVTAGSFEIPMWMSIPACIVTAVLPIWLLMENKK